MKMGNILAALGLLLALASAGSVKAQAAESDSGTQCQPFTITVSVAISEMSYGVEVETQELNEEAAKSCYGHHFVIDSSSIERKRFMYAHTGFDPKYGIGVTARVACMNY